MSAAGGSGVETGGHPTDHDIYPGSVLPPHSGPSVQADSTWRVDSTGDSTNGSCGAAPINSTCTLRAALLNANSNSGTQTVIVPTGTFRLTLAGGDDSGAAGDLDIVASRNVVVKGQGPANTIIDGTGIDRVFDVQPNANLTLTDLKITGGSVTGTSGGGLRNRGTATLDNVQVTGNTTRGNSTNEGDGGGIVNQNSASMTISNSQITGNQAISSGGNGGFGGGIGNFTNSTLTITNSEISGNSAGDNGGGITQNGARNSQDSETLTITNSIISNNTAVAGGGIVSGGDGTTTVNLTTTTVSSNQATGGNGGGISMANQNGTLRITNSTISNNTSPNNNSFAGGGIRIGGPGTSAIITSSTIVNNSANSGGGISSASVNGTAASVSVAGSVFANNSGGNCSTSYGGTDNAEGSANTCGFTFPNLSTGLSTGTPATNEGFTPVFVPPLTPQSPLIDAANSCSGQTVDQRGVSRPQSPIVNKCDIGSVEVQPTTNFDCSTRSRLKVLTTKLSPGILQVSVSTFNPNTAQVEPNNRIKSFTLGLATNAVVLPTRPVVGGTSLTFRIIRPAALNADATGAGTVQFTLTDRCGDYKSFAGGGVNAWN